MGKLTPTGLRVPVGRARSLPAMLSEDTIRAMRASADPVDFIVQQRRLDKLMGRDVYEGPSFDGIDVPDDPLPAMVSATGAPRSWMERAAYEAPITAAMKDGELPPLLDMLRAADRSRALTDSRLARMSPEQQASSLAFVGRQAEQDPFFSSAAKQQRRSEGRQEAAIGAAIAALPLAFAAKMAKEASDAGYFDPEQPFEDSLPLEAYEPSYPDIGEEPLDLPSVDVPVGTEDLVDAYINGRDLRIEPGRGVMDGEDMLFAEDQLGMMVRDTPEEAVSLKPGPVDVPVLSRPQARSVQALVAKGIGYDRAMDIITGRASMSPGEYEMVTGGRR